jgi:hypothetical protein
LLGDEITPTTCVQTSSGKRLKGDNLYVSSVPDHGSVKRNLFDDFGGHDSTHDTSSAAEKGDDSSLQS